MNLTSVILKKRRYIFSFSFLINAVIILMMYGSSKGANTTVFPTPGNLQHRYTTPGIYTFTVPEGVTSITIETWGGGGRGGSRTTSTDGTGGGGGGAYTRHILSVIPGESYVVQVGSGSTSNTAPGGDSWVSLTNAAAALVLSKGGNSAASNSTAGATGGSSASGIGTTKFSGGNGANRVSTTASGGGGSSAGTAANGNNASRKYGRSCSCRRR
jgi:hypothetical protein